jgi:ATP synthase protein I
VIAQPLSSIRWPGLYRIALAQLITVCVVALLCGFWPGVEAGFWNKVPAYSALLGGLICWLSSLYFMIRCFQYQGAQAMMHVLSNMYKAEAHKFLLVAVLFGCVFKYVAPLEPVTLFIGFICVQVVHAFSGILAKL